MRIPALVLVTLVVAACGSDPIRESAPPPSPLAQGGPTTGPAAGPGTAPSAALSVRREPYDDPRLDPIRDKVPLSLRAGAVRAEQLRDESRPSREEKRAIRLWNEIREQAHQSAPPPSPLLMQTRVRMTRAITQLYAGQLTYAEFARRVQSIDAQHKSASRPRLGQR